MTRFSPLSICGSIAVSSLLLYSNAAHAVCSPSTAPEAGLFVFDLADCGSPLDGNYCARQLAQPALAPCTATPPKPEPLPVDLAMFRSNGMAAVSHPISLRDARPDGDPRLPMSSSEALERFAAGIDAQSGGAMFAALALAAFQMRRRKGMRVVVA